MPAYRVEGVHDDTAPGGHYWVVGRTHAEAMARAQERARELGASSDVLSNLQLVQVSCCYCFFFKKKNANYLFCKN